MTLQCRPVGNGHVLVGEPAANGEKIDVTKRDPFADQVDVTGQMMFDNGEPAAQMLFARPKECLWC